MIRRPLEFQRSTTLLHSTTLFRSQEADGTAEGSTGQDPGTQDRGARTADRQHRQWQGQVDRRIWHGDPQPRLGHEGRHRPVRQRDMGNRREEFLQGPRSEERRVGKEYVSTCRSRRAPYHEKKKQSKRKNRKTTIE